MLIAVCTIVFKFIRFFLPLFLPPCLIITHTVAVPSLAPTITSLQRSSATSARIGWDPIPHQNRNGDLVAYHLNYSAAVNRSCVSLPDNPFTSLVSASESVGFLSNLDPLSSYCIRMAGSTAYGIGVFGRLWKIPCESIIKST